MRRYVGDEKYVVETIGTADDFSDADGAEILSFHQAQAKARAAVTDLREVKPAEPFTVDRALDAYLERMTSEHSKSVADARNRVDNLIRPRLGQVPRFRTDARRNYEVAKCDRDKAASCSREERAGVSRPCRSHDRRRKAPAPCEREPDADNLEGRA